MSRSKIVLSLVAFTCVAVSASAMEFQVLGAKAASMGGAGIATSPSALASYNNPALLANNPEKFSIHIGAGVGVKDTGAGKAIGDLSDLDFSGAMENIDGANIDVTNPATITALQNDINTIKAARNILADMNQKGFQLNPTVDVALSFGSFGAGVFVTTDIGAVANVDQTRTGLIFQASNGNYYDLDTLSVSNYTNYVNSSIYYAAGDPNNPNKTTNLDIVGLAVAEVPLAYGHAFDTPVGSLAIGGSLKLMAGKTFYQNINIDSDNALDDIDKNVQDSTTFGIDLGLALKPSESLTLALVGKNLNTPAFDIAAVAGGGEYELEPMIRVGAAYKPNSWIELAFDADLTTNKGLTGYDTRYLGGGVNFDLSVVELNAGLMKNIASEDEAGLIYTAGVATGPDWLHFELSAQMASKTGEIDGTQYPKQASVNFAISSAW
jgi:hypothetical protein